MGRATRWLRSLLGWKKESKEQMDCGRGGEERRVKKRWSFCRSGSNPGEVADQIRPTTLEEAAWMRSWYAESEKEQSKHALAVAAATAAAADAAVAAAQAAVAVVRLTSQGRGAMFGVHERLAAVKIQTVFRGYLAKRALRALKALVKLQALVRGYLVRKQAAATLHSMQALVRAQATVRAHKFHSHLAMDRTFRQEIRSRRSLERFDDTRSEHMASTHSRRLSASLDNGSYGSDKSPKTVEVDTCRPKSRSSFRSSPFALDSADDDDMHPLSMSSPLQCQFPAHITIPDCRNLKDYDWCFSGDSKCRFSSTAHCTPRYMNSTDNPPVTPAKSISTADGFFRRFPNVADNPNYMAKTQSFEAKVRSQSAPKQRPEAVGQRKRIPLSEVMVDSRASLSGVGMERSCSKVQDALSFKGNVLGRVDRSLELGMEAEREFYFQRNW